MELRERVAELVKLRDAATPGPWERRYSFNIFAKERHIASAGGHSNSIRAEQVHNENNANAALIAAAPAAVTLCADLMARVEELERAAGMLAAHLEDWIDNEPATCFCDGDDASGECYLCKARNVLKKADVIYRALERKEGSDVS